MRRAVLTILLLTALLHLPSPAQTPRAEPTPAYGSDVSYAEILSPPLPVSARMPLALTSETERTNYVTFGAEVSAGFDDNALSTADHRVSDVSYLFAPSLDLRLNRERWSWDAAYSPGFTVSQKFDQHNQSSQNLLSTLDLRLSPHVGVSVREGFQQTNSLFSGLVGSSPSASAAPLQTMNTTVVTPFANFMANQSAVDLNYQFSASSLVGASGNYNFLNYAEVAGTSEGLIDSRSVGGDAFYGHRLESRQWIGVMYNFQRLTFDPGSRTTVHRTLLFYSIPFGAHAALSLWGGPEYSITPALATGKDRWSGAGGAAFSVEWARTALRAEFGRQISDGGGIAEAVTQQHVESEVMYRFMARWTASLGLGYAENDPLDRLLASPFRGWSGTCAIDYRLTDHLSFGAGYAREHQKYFDTAYYSSPLNRNRVTFSIAYSFARPIGR